MPHSSSIGLLADAPHRSGLFLDFDGVLADIARDHDAARPRPAVPELLARLDERLGRLAIISGRPVSYLSQWLPEHLELVGLYGLEWRTDGVYSAWNEAEAWRPVVESVAADAKARFGLDSVEPKGLSLTIHYRTRGGDEAEMNDWARDHGGAVGLAIRPARMSIELHPPVERDKGTALVERARGLATVAYLGDDTGDIPAFDALDRLAEHGMRSIKVAVSSVESPADLIRRADTVLDGTRGAERFLRDLVLRIDSSASP